jgi:hypothetical protein
MAKKSVANLNGFENLIMRLDEIQGNVKDFVIESLEAVGEDVGVYTHEAMNKANLPAGGKYSTGETAKSVIINPKAEFNGVVASVNLGFDKTKDGVGDILIHGTPRQKPVQALVDIYKRKKFWKKLSDGLTDSFNDYVRETMEG